MTMMTRAQHLDRQWHCLRLKTWAKGGVKRHPEGEGGHEAEVGDEVASKHFSRRQIQTDISKLLLAQGVDPEVVEVSLVEKVAVEVEKVDVP